MPISPYLQQNITDLQNLLSMAPGFVIRYFQIKATGQEAVLVYMNELTDHKSINDNVLFPLMHESNPAHMRVERMVTVGHVWTCSDLLQVENAILQGRSAIFVEGLRSADILNTQGWPQRAIEDPALEASLKGSHQGFVETGSQNVALIRRFIPNRELKIKTFIVGRRGQTKLSLMYLADVMNPQILQEMEDRLVQIDVDAIINSGELEELLEDNPYSPFPQFTMTERPDSAASQILQGRMAIVVDRSPGVLIAPTTFSTFFQSVDDYSIRWQVASFLRLLRFGAFIVTIFLPSIYIAVISFNFEVIPLRLLLSVGESRGNVPLPPILEALIMEVTLEMLKEAGIRLPAPIGQTVGIVGAIVIGQASVQAGVVSNIMVIVVALTGLASFIIPNHDMSATVRLIRFPMMIIASIYGLLGVGVGSIVLVGHLISLESLGTPYLSPISPLRLADWKDTFIRLPLWKMKKRPLSVKPVQENRFGQNHHSKDER